MNFMLIIKNSCIDNLWITMNKLVETNVCMHNCRVFLISKCTIAGFHCINLLTCGFVHSARASFATFATTPSFSLFKSASEWLVGGGGGKSRRTGHSIQRRRHQLRMWMKQEQVWEGRQTTSAILRGFGEIICAGWVEEWNEKKIMREGRGKQKERMTERKTWGEEWGRKNNQKESDHTDRETNGGWGSLWQRETAWELWWGLWGQVMPFTLC